MYKVLFYISFAVLRYVLLLVNKLKKRNGIPVSRVIFNYMYIKLINTDTDVRRSFIVIVWASSLCTNLFNIIALTLEANWKFGIKQNLSASIFNTYTCITYVFKLEPLPLPVPTPMHYNHTMFASYSIFLLPTCKINYVNMIIMLTCDIFIYTCNITIDMQLIYSDVTEAN